VYAYLHIIIHSFFQIRVVVPIRNRRLLRIDGSYEFAVYATLFYVIYICIHVRNKNHRIFSYRPARGAFDAGDSGFSWAAIEPRKTRHAVLSRNTLRPRVTSRPTLPLGPFLPAESKRVTVHGQFSLHTSNSLHASTLCSGQTIRAGVDDGGHTQQSPENLVRPSPRVCL